MSGHRDRPHAGERQRVADLQELFEDDEYRADDEPDEPQAVVDVAAVDEA